MTLRIDPERHEIHALRQVADWYGRRVLEVGCGDGRLTKRLARLGADVQAIDPDPALVTSAAERLPQRLAPRVRFHVGRAGRLEYPQAAFDLVVFSWVL